MLVECLAPRVRMYNALPGCLAPGPCVRGVGTADAATVSAESAESGESAGVFQNRSFLLRESSLLPPGGALA